MFFVCLPCRYIAREANYLEYFLSHGLNPELCLDAWSLDNKGEVWFKELAHALEQQGLGSSVHLPFVDVHPGSPDAFVLGAARERLAKAFDRAVLLGARHMIGHVDHHPDIHGEDPRAWLEQHTATWDGLLARWPEHPPLYLENTFEPDPEPVRDAAAALSHHDVGVCFDAPHWHAFARGFERKDLGRWLDCLGPLVRHLHLHDNDGSHDQHRGMGQGAIPWGEFFRRLRDQGVRPGFTLEPHDETSLAGSLAFMQDHAQWFGQLSGVEKS